MANTLALNLRLEANGTLTKGIDLSSAIDTVTIGNGDFDAITLTITDGATGANKANEWWHDERTVAGTTADDLDLTGALTNAFGETVVFNAIRMILIAIDTPDGSKLLRVGPQAVSEAVVEPFGDASDYVKVFEYFLWTNFAGTNGSPVVVNTTDKLGIYNPGATSVTYRIWIVGTKTVA